MLELVATREKREAERRHAIQVAMRSAMTVGSNSETASPTPEYTDYREKILKHGPIPVDEWMQSVLEGYYKAGQAVINSSGEETGDFATILSNPADCAAIYFHITEHLQTQSTSPVFLSVATGNQDFERNLRIIESAEAHNPDRTYLPENTRYISLDYSFSRLNDQASPLELFNDILANHETRNWSEEDGLEILVMYSYERLFKLTPDQLQILTKCINPLQEFEYIAPAQSEFMSVRDLRNRTGLPPDVDQQLRTNLAELDLEQETTNAIYEYFTNYYDYFKEVCRTEAIRRSTLHQEKVAASGLELPFSDNSCDVVFSNEFHDALPTKVFRFDEASGKIFEVHVDYTPHQSDQPDEEGTFSCVEQPCSEELLPIAKLKLQFIKESKKSRLSPKGYFTVPLGSIEYIQEAARVLRSGGVYFNSDYVIHTKDDFFDVQVRFQTEVPISDVLTHVEKMDNPRTMMDWNNELLKDIVKFTFPGLDITVDMDVPFLIWVAQAYGFRVVLNKTHPDFVKESNNGKTGFTSNANFWVLSFVKR